MFTFQAQNVKKNTSIVFNRDHKTESKFAMYSIRTIRAKKTCELRNSAYATVPLFVFISK